MNLSMMGSFYTRHSQMGHRLLMASMCKNCVCRVSLSYFSNLSWSLHAQLYQQNSKYEFQLNMEVQVQNAHRPAISSLQPDFQKQVVQSSNRVKVQVLSPGHVPPG
jgi:hypothetical protein